MLGAGARCSHSARGMTRIAYTVPGTLDRMRTWRVLDFVGKTLIGAGVLVLLFVVYQLWGTGIIEHRAQDQLAKDFASIVPKNLPKSETDFPPGPPPPPPGNAVAAIRIPAIGVDKVVVQGVGVPDLKKGPGHYPQTPFPGQKGNAAIAGHRTTYGAPFNRLDELNNDDVIDVTTKQGAFEYRVMEKKVVKPHDVSVLNATDDDRLTLTTCNPKYSAATRLVVIAKLIGPAAPVSPPAKQEDIDASNKASNDPNNNTAVSEDANDAPGLSGESAPKGPAILWGAIAAVIFVLILVIAKRWRKWPTYIIGAPIFLIALFFFFENFSRLLPSNI